MTDLQIAVQDADQLSSAVENERNNTGQRRQRVIGMGDRLVVGMMMIAASPLRRDPRQRVSDQTAAGSFEMVGPQKQDAQQKDTTEGGQGPYACRPVSEHRLGIADLAVYCAASEEGKKRRQGFIKENL